MPEDALAMERYLGSGAIKGIGAALAARIVRRFGEDTLRIVEEEPERLAEIKGISEKKAREIAVQVEEKADMRRAMMFLQKYGISLNLGAKIYQKYGDSVYNVLQEKSLPHRRGYQRRRFPDGGRDRRTYRDTYGFRLQDPERHDVYFISGGGGRPCVSSERGTVPSGQRAAGRG